MSGSWGCSRCLLLGLGVDSGAQADDGSGSPVGHGHRKRQDVRVCPTQLLLTGVCSAVFDACF